MVASEGKPWKDEEKRQKRVRDLLTSIFFSFTCAPLLFCTRLMSVNHGGTFSERFEDRMIFLLPLSDKYRDVRVDSERSGEL